MMIPPVEEGWMPIRILKGESGWRVDWCALGSLPFADPFFSGTINRALREPFRLLFRRETPIEELAELHAQHPGVPPAGFIFHLSRCGSTLIAQMLAALSSNVVLSEAPPIDLVLRAHLRDPAVTEEQRILWLRGLLNAYGQPRRGDERRLFVKFDAWNTLDLPLVRRAFPEVPWIFVYRDPLEVMVSQLRQRAAYLVPGMFFFGIPGLDGPDAFSISPEQFCARILARIAAAPLAHLDSPRSRLVHYSELPDAVCTWLPRFFGFEPTDDDLRRLREATQFDAKNPGLFFDPNSRSKASSATPAARAATEEWLQPIYTQLEAARTAPT